MQQRISLLLSLLTAMLYWLIHKGKEWGGSIRMSEWEKRGFGQIKQGDFYFLKDRHLKIIKGSSTHLV